MSDPPETLLQELRTLTHAERFDWHGERALVLNDAGLRDYTAVQWAAVPWYGPLEAWLRDTAVSDILINGPTREVFVVRDGAMRATGQALHSSWLDWLQTQIAARGGAVNPAFPDIWQRADGSATHLLEGSAERRLRFAISRPPASPDGPSISVRVLPARWRTLDDLIKLGVLPRRAAELLLDAVQHGVSLLIGGTTGSGKTTLSAALLQAVGEGKRVVIIEESRELPVLPNSVSMEVSLSGARFSDMVRFALRQKPHLIVVGEARGPEALALLQAAATGHPGIATIHADGVQAALRNLERMACEQPDVPPTLIRSMITATQAPLIICHIGQYGGTRQVGQIEEVLEMGMTGGVGSRYMTNPLWSFNPHTNQVEPTNPVQAAWGRGRW